MDERNEWMKEMNMNEGNECEKIYKCKKKITGCDLPKMWEKDLYKKRRMWRDLTSLNLDL